MPPARPSAKSLMLPSYGTHDNTSPHEKADVPPSAQIVSKPARVNLWDNARFLLIVLVVVGHAISTIRTETSFAFASYALIYLFHMPGMIALSGVFSKPTVTPKAARSTVQLLAVWLLWEVLWAVIHWFETGRDLPGSWLVVSAWSLWFLVTLATMRILLPFIARVRHPLLLSVALALAAGLSPSIGTEFSASRTLCFLPFFVAAWLAADRGWFAKQWFQQPSTALRSAAWSVFAVVIAIFALIPQLREVWRIDKWLTWRNDYAWLFAHAPLGVLEPAAQWQQALLGIGVRAVLLLVAAAMIMALLLLVPRYKTFFTVWGTRTLFVYLLHGPIIYFLRASGVVDAVGAWGVPGVLVLMVGAIGLAVVLSLSWVVPVFWRIIEPKLSWMYGSDQEQIKSEATHK